MGCHFIEDNMQQARKMYEKERTAITQYLTELLEVAQPRMQDYLVEYGMLDLYHDVEQINAGQTPTDRMRILVQLAIKKPAVDPFGTFLRALGHSDNHLAIKIRTSYDQATQPTLVAPAPLPTTPPNVPNNLGRQEKKVRVNFESRQPRRIGMQVADGNEHPRWPGDNELYICFLEPGQPAKQSGVLEEKDTLHKVNGRHVAGMTTEQLSQIFGPRSEAITQVTIRRWITMPPRYPVNL